MNFHIIIYAIVIGTISLQVINSQSNVTFDTLYSPTWGLDNLVIDPQGTEVHLTMDQLTGGAGFRSKSDFGSGLFQIMMKISEKKTGGIITSFYLTSLPNNEQVDHFEFDFEFIGTTGRLKTNVFNNDNGRRNQVFQLGFDPSLDYHLYEILWNSYQIAFFIDKIPVRVFKNNSAQGLARFPSQAMHVECSIWNASDWAGVVDWSLSPFVTSYQDFDFDACVVAQNDDISECASDQFLWNGADFRELNDTQKQQMDGFRNAYLIYDYCSDPNLVRPECSFNI